MQTIAGLLSPIVIFYNLSKPLAGGKFPMIYVLGLYMVAMAYSLLYRMLRNDGMWLYAFIGTFFYITFSPQLLWALARIRDGKWGTRDSGGPAAPTTPHAPRESDRDTVPIRQYVPAAYFEYGPSPRVVEDG